jgi:branched-chain amino acid transport system permease protein
MTWQTVIQLLFSGLALGAVYGLVALSYSTIYATRNVINFGQGELVVLGSLLGVSMVVGGKVPVLIALVVAAAVVALAALLVEWLAVRSVKEVTRNMIWVMSTFGLGICMNQLMQKIWGTDPVRFPKFIGKDEPIQLGQVTMLPQELGVIIIAVVVAVAFEAFRRNTLMGKAVRATAMDRDTASLMGIDTRKVVYGSYALSGALATLCGFLVAPIQFADPNGGVLLSVKGFIALVIGGLGSPIGGFLGGLFLGLLEIGSASLISEVWKDVITFSALILVMLIRPSGFFGRLG